MPRGFTVFYKRNDEVSITPDDTFALNVYVVVSLATRKAFLEDLHFDHLDIEKMKSPTKVSYL